MKMLITLSLFIGITAMAAVTAEGQSSGEEALVHTVFFWFHNDVTEEQSNEFYQELKKLKEIPQIQHGWIGVPAATEERGVIDSSYDYSITFVFADEAAEHEYQVHPIHTAFVETNSHLWENVTVYDAITPEE
jgi:ABC-type glycerol-3-phosphate transport system substrate-binding protein